MCALSCLGCSFLDTRVCRSRSLSLLALRGQPLFSKACGLLFLQPAGPPESRDSVLEGAGVRKSEEHLILQLTFPRGERDFLLASKIGLGESICRSVALLTTRTARAKLSRSRRRLDLAHPADERQRPRASNRIETTTTTTTTTMNAMISVGSPRASLPSGAGRGRAANARGRRPLRLGQTDLGGRGRRVAARASEGKQEEAFNFPGMTPISSHNS